MDAGPAPDPAAVRWCFSWLAYDAAATPSRWVTVCGKARTVEERNACDTASLTLVRPPPDRTPSVLVDAKPGDRSALVRCDLMAGKAQQEPARAPQWTAKFERCKQLESFYLAKVFVPDDPKQDPGGRDCAVADVSCQVGAAVEKAIAGGIRLGMQGLVDLTVQAMAWMLGKLAELVFASTDAGSPDDTYFWVYNQISGVLLILVFLFFLISTIVNGLRVNGPGPVATLGGLVRAFMGITFAGGIAWLIVQAWDQATATLIERNSTRQWDPSMWIKAITALAGGAGTTFVAFLVAVFAVIGLVLVFIQMFFRSLLAAGAGLFGSMAFAGQVMHEGRAWGRRWLWTVNALASSKFWIASLWIYGSRETYESNDLMTVLKSLLLIWVMVLAPGIMLRLTTMWDGYLSDVNARGVLSAAGHAADAAGIGSMFGKAGSMFGPSGGGSGGSDAAGLMNANSADIATNPAKGVGQATGLSDGPSREAAESVQTGADGGRVGDLSAVADGGQSGAPDSGAGSDDAGRPNAEEAQGVQQGTDAAGHAVSSGQLSPPGAEGSGGSLPLTPHAAQDTATGDGAGPADPGALMGHAAGLDGSTPGEGATADAPSPGGDAHGAAGGGQAHGSGESGSSSQPAAGGGSAEAGAAAEIPIVPV